MSANRLFQTNKKAVKEYKSFQKRNEISIYNTMIRPVLMYSKETITMTRKYEETMTILERKILIIVIGPIELIHNLQKEIKDCCDICIKQQRIKWLEQV